MIDKEQLRIAYLAGNNDSKEAESNDLINNYFEAWYKNQGIAITIKQSNENAYNEGFQEGARAAANDIMGKY